MPDAIRCPNPGCGAVLRRPEGPSPRRARCPRCGEAIGLDSPPEAPDAGTVADPIPLDDDGRTEPDTEARQGIGLGPTGDSPPPTASLATDDPRGPLRYGPTIDWGGDGGGQPPTPAGPGSQYEVGLVASSPDLPPRIGRFVVRKALGAGTFGTVYLAFDPQLEREVALKVPRPSASGSARVLAEARAAARLRHPGIVQVFEVGSADGLDYIASAVIDGRSLADAIADGALGPGDPVRSARVVRALADALAYAHGHGVVHRDVKPSNVLLDARGKPHLTDFGLAVRPEDSERSGVAGTPAYMSPEQARGDEARPASDQYALGVILYELLAGRPPFLGTVASVLYDAAHRAPSPPRLLRPDAPGGLETICLRALAKDPAARFPDCGALADALRDWLRRHGSPRGDSDRLVRLIERLPVLGRMRPGATRRLVALLLLGSVVLAVGGLAAFATLGALDYLHFGVRVIHPRLTAADAGPSWEARPADLLLDLAFPPGDRALIAVGPGVGTWDRDDGDRIDWEPDARPPTRAIAVSPDGRWLALGDEDGVLTIRDARTGADRHRIAAHASAIADLAFSADGARLASASWDHTAKLFDPATGHEHATLRGHADAVSSVAFRPDGRLVATAGDGRAILWDAESGVPVRELAGHRDAVTGVAFTPSGDLLATSSLDGTVRLWDPDSGRARSELRGPGRPLLAVAVSPDGRWLAAAEGEPLPPSGPSPQPAAVWLWEADDPRHARLLRASQGSIGRLAFDPDSLQIAALGLDGSIACWPLAARPGR